MEYFKSEVMELCHEAGLYQIDLLNGSANRITERENWARKKGQLAIDRENEKRRENHEPLIHTKFETDKEKLRQTILKALDRADSFDKATVDAASAEAREARSRYDAAAAKATDKKAMLEAMDNYRKTYPVIKEYPYGCSMLKTAASPNLKPASPLCAAGPSTFSTVLMCHIPTASPRAATTRSRCSSASASVSEAFPPLGTGSFTALHDRLGKIMIDALVRPLAALPKYLGLRLQSSAAFSLLRSRLLHS